MVRCVAVPQSVAECNLKLSSHTRQGISGESEGKWRCIIVG